MSSVITQSSSRVTSCLCVSVSPFGGWMHPRRAAAIHRGRGDCWSQHWSWGHSEWVDSGLVTRQLSGYALPCVCLFLSQGVLVMKPNVWFNWGLQRSNSSWGQLNCTSRFDLGSCQQSQGRIGVIGLQPLPLHSTLDTQHTDLLTHLYDCRPVSRVWRECAGESRSLGHLFNWGRQEVDQP